MNTEAQRYTLVAIGLHWIIALLIIANVWIGIDFADVAPPGERFPPKPLLPLHITIGIAVLLLSFARLAWRLFHKPPPHPPEMPKWEAWLATAAHWLFYGLIIGMPMTGWLILSSHNRTTLLQGVFGFQWPRVPFMHRIPAETVDRVHEVFVEIHSLLSQQIFFAMLALHVGAVLKHHLFDKDPVLMRMLPVRCGSAKPPESSNLS